MQLQYYMHEMTGVTPIQLGAAGVVLLFALAPCAAFLPPRPTSARLIYLACALLCGALAALGLSVLVSTATPGSHLVLPVGLPFARSELGLDALSAVFFVIANLTSAIVSAGAIGYGATRASRSGSCLSTRRSSRHESGAAGARRIFFPGRLGVHVARILGAGGERAPECRKPTRRPRLSHHGERRSARAVARVRSARGDRRADTRSRRSVPRAHRGVGAIVLLLALIGAGSKAGLVPLHAWLPLAHPAAPSHVSALMSGVMTKVAVYGFVRLVVRPRRATRLVVERAGTGDRRHHGSARCSVRVDGARSEAPARVPHGREHRHHLYRLRTCACVRGDGLLAAAALALTAAIFHVFNHSLFKSLLFMGSGAVLNATGERDMEQLGGLIHRMPVTAMAFLAGCIAISALPPFNGFVSEWLTFQAILLSPQLPQWVPRLLVPAVGATLACSAALAAACFVKAFGMTFLGRAAQRCRTAARETDRWSQSRCSHLAGYACLPAYCPASSSTPWRPRVNAGGSTARAAVCAAVAADRAHRPGTQRV